MRPGKSYVLFTGLVVALLLNGCSFAPVGDEGLAKDADQPQIRPSTETSKPVLALLGKAREAAQNGELAVAEAQLERALRIEPRDPVLWHYMAKLRLHQNRLSQAAGLAAKSNSLDRNQNKQLQADNWRIIAHARHRKGDTAGAKAAQAKADALTGKN